MYKIDWCWFFSLKITATLAKMTSKSEGGFSNLWIAGKYLLWPKFWISFPFNHIRFAAAACQPELWIAGKYFSLPTFIFVTTIFLQHCTEPTIFWNCVRTRLVLNDCFHQNHHHIDFISICYCLFHAAILLQVMSVVQLQAMYPDCLFSHMSLKELEE